MRCLCGSRRSYKRCCLVAHEKGARTPEALMRSRYVAYAKGLVDYIMATTDPAGPQFNPNTEAWRAEILAFSSGARFVGLEVVSAVEDGDEGWVGFRATLTMGDQASVLAEHSYFRRVDGRWLYTSGEPLP
jgi:SEC-C motif domain protein